MNQKIIILGSHLHFGQFAKFVPCKIACYVVCDSCSYMYCTCIITCRIEPLILIKFHYHPGRDLFFA